MPYKNDNNSDEEFVIEYLKKNKNFFIKFPEIVNNLNFVLKDKSSSKVIDLEAYRYKKTSQNNIDLQNQMTKILLAAKNHSSSQRRILRSSLRILKTKNFSKLIEVVLNDFKSLLECDIINCYSTSNILKNDNVSIVDKKIAFSYFKNKLSTNLNQNPKGILLFFPNKLKIIKSYILLKIQYEKNFLIIAMGSKNKEKFSQDQKVDLIEYLIQIIENKINNL
ncbi:DUF484 family protein [Alphaproteobacteria bacterium]|nr:DUF484 family protein [Alphaproteobacteria bacterium]